MSKQLTIGAIQTAEDAAEWIEQRGVRQVKVAATDIDGVLRGKYISKEKFLSSLKNGLGFCDVIFGWDSSDVLYTEDSITGWQTAFPDAQARIDVTTCRELPLEDNTPLFLMDFEQEEPHRQVCPRSLLKRVISQADALGMDFRAAAEFEFFLFEETPGSLRAKDYRLLENITPDMFGYSVIRNSTHADFYHALMDMSRTMRMPIEGIHTETGPGVLEVALEHDTLLQAADQAVLFKTFTKVLAQQHGMMATFMAKYSNDYPGQSGHLHMSAWRDGEPLFYDPTQPDGLSETMRYFIGGQQRLLPELLSMIAPTTNAYTRLIPGFWAPTQATWGIDNRTCALRAITGSPKSQRLEYRVAAADINPYIALAAAVGSGLWGIRNRIEPTEPIRGNAYEVHLPDAYQFPRDLYAAARRLRASEAAREIFGDVFVDHYAMTREHEANEERKAVTDWQLRRYFEII